MLGGGTILDRSRARLLDVDDLILLSLFLEGLSQAEIASRLRLSSPAVAHRSNKYFDVFGMDLFTRVGSKKKLSEEGVEISKKMKKALIAILYGDSKVKVKIKDIF